MSLRRLALVAFCVVLAACSKVNQENYSKIKTGMSKAEVEDLLGKPTECSGALGVSSCTWGDEKAFISIQYAGDKVLLDGYLDTVREIERRVQLAQNRDLSGVKAPEIPEAEQDIAIDKEVRLLFDLIAVAYQANLTRVASFIMIGEGTNRTYNHIGVPDSFHPLSHHADYPDRLEKLVKIQRYHVERFAEFVAKLAATPDGEGTLLDNSMLLYGSNMSNSNLHSNYPLPTILVGGGAGTLKGGQHIELPERTTISNLHLTLLNKAGLEMKSFGDSSGEIAVA